MNTSELIDILQVKIEDSESAKKLISTTLNYLEKAETAKFIIQRPKFLILTKKLLSALKLHYQQEYSEGLENNLLNLSTELDFSIKQCARRSEASAFALALLRVSTLNISSPMGYQRRCHDLAGELEDLLLSIISKINIFQDRNFSFFDLYIPEGANKLDAERLIQDAIEIVKKDSSLTVEAREKIISQLEDAISALRRGNTSDFFGTVTEIIIILGALGSLASGMVAISQAEAKLNEAIDIVEGTSINQNYKSLGYKPNCFSDSNLLPPANFNELPPAQDSISETQ